MGTISLLAKGIWDEQSAQDGLVVLNQKVASIFGQAPKDVKFVFVELIDKRETLSENGIIVRERLGLCSHQNLTILLVIDRRWARTAVHELVHLYNPGRSEKKVKSLTEEVIQYLKQINQQGVR